jgi:hypothetical protein
MDTPGWRNATPLLEECALQILDDWHGGSRDRYHISRAVLQARSTIDVLRERGLLTGQALELLKRDAEGADYMTPTERRETLRKTEFSYLEDKTP